MATIPKKKVAVAKKTAKKKTAEKVYDSGEPSLDVIASKQKVNKMKVTLRSVSPYMCNQFGNKAL